jgi:hypothetical protein
MAEQDLNGTEIDAGFQQVGGEGVPQQVRMNRLGDARVVMMSRCPFRASSILWTCRPAATC